MTDPGRGDERSAGGGATEPSRGEPYYRAPLALVHHLGFAAHAHLSAPGILELLAPVRASGGLVVELGCGSGLLTRHLLDAGHRVIATDASPAMLELARGLVPDVVDFATLVLPDDPIPPADAIVSVGHVLNYLPDAASIDRALVAIAGALRPGGILAIDLCDLEWGAARLDLAPLGRVGDDWAIVNRTSVPAADRFVREMTIFTRDADGAWRRDDERHDNVLVDVALVPPLLERHGVDAAIQLAFGQEEVPTGLRIVVGRRRS